MQANNFKYRKQKEAKERRVSALKVKSQYYKMLKKEGMLPSSSSEVDYPEIENSSNSTGQREIKHTSTNKRYDPFKKAKEIRTKVLNEKEEARQQRLKEIEERTERHQKSQQKREKMRKLYSRKTPTGQPLMSVRINHLLDKIKQDIAGES